MTDRQIWFLTGSQGLYGDDVLDQVIAPLLFTIGSLWHQGQLKPANEHLATMTIRRVPTHNVSEVSTDYVPSGSKAFLPNHF